MEGDLAPPQSLDSPHGRREPSTPLRSLLALACMWDSSKLPGPGLSQGAGLESHDLARAG
eukprot:scaffold200901_cov35-Tisochrysis_lutea.AAC.1